MGLTILLMVLFGGIIFRSTVESLESSWVDASLFARQSLLHGWLVSGWEQNMQRRAGGVKSLWAHFHPSQRPPLGCSAKCSDKRSARSLKKFLSQYFAEVYWVSKWKERIHPRLHQNGRSLSASNPRISSY